MIQSEAGLAPPPFDVESVRRDFPILATSVRGKPLTYLDNAATSQKPAAVIEAVDRYYRSGNANIHRGVHYLSEQATDAYEGARRTVAGFVNAPDPDEVIFVRGATEGINLVAHGFTESVLGPGDEILITHMEHHANIVPWQIAAGKSGAVLEVAPVDDRGVLDLDGFEKRISEKTRIVAVTHVSNALGTINPAAEIIGMAHARGVPVLLDASQSAPHMPLDVAALDCEFLVFSGHKVFGPTGIGVLHGKRAWLERFPPYESGGDMIVRVSFEGTTYKEIPGKFEAGTPHVAGGIGLAAALDYLSGIDRAAAAAHEDRLVARATAALAGIDGLRLVGTAPEKTGVVSFVIDGIHPHDIGTFLDADGVAIRAGHHCTQPLMERFGVPATARASFAFYNTEEEVDRLAEAVAKLKKFFG